MFLGYLVAGMFGGLFGGMGMGGGTVLIPILSIFFSTNQHLAQAVNLISFIPMAVVALIVHLKNKLVVFKDAKIIVLFGIITCIIGSILASNLQANLLSKLFGGFLIILSIFQLISIARKDWIFVVKFNNKSIKKAIKKFFQKKSKKI